MRKEEPQQLANGDWSFLHSFGKSSTSLSKVDWRVLNVKKTDWEHFKLMVTLKAKEWLSDLRISSQYGRSSTWLSIPFKGRWSVGKTKFECIYCQETQHGYQPLQGALKYVGKTKFEYILSRKSTWLSTPSESWVLRGRNSSFGNWRRCIL